MREEFVNTWKSAKASSPKLEFYNLIKHDFESEAYIRMIKIPDVQKSLTRFHISCHNLYIERADIRPPLYQEKNVGALTAFPARGSSLLRTEIMC